VKKETGGWEDGSEIYLIDDGFQAFFCALLTLKTSSIRQGRISYEKLSHLKIFFCNIQPLQIGSEINRFQRQE